MNKLFIISFLLIFTLGCRHDLRPDEAHGAETVTLCRNIYYKEYTEDAIHSALNEVAKREDNCDRFYTGFREYDLGFELGRALANGMRTKCHTTYYGNQADTVCN